MAGVAGPSLLDASAIIAWANDEPGGDVVAQYLPGGHVASPTVAELVMKLASWGVDGQAFVGDLVAAGITVVPFTLDHAKYVENLRRIDVDHRRRHRGHLLSLGDLCCLAVAMVDDYEVVTADRHWAAVMRKARIRLIR